MSQSSVAAADARLNHSRTPSRLTAHLTLLCPAVLFVAMLGQKDVVTSHEARVVQTARQMAAAGWPWNARPVSVAVVSLQKTPAGLRLRPVPEGERQDVNPWLVPVLNDALRLQKPPLPYWCAATLFRVAHVDFSEALARFFPALFGALAAFLIANIAGRVFGRRWFAVAGLIWLSCYFAFDEFRKAMADPYLAFFSLACIWAWIGATASKRPTAWLLIAYASFALASLAKFPVNVLHVGCALLAFHLCYRRRVPGSWTAHALGVLLFLAIGFPWPIYVLTHVPHAMELWRYESVGEFADNTEKARPFWMYFANMFTLILPWTPLWIAGVVAVALRRSRRQWFPLAWFTSELVIFSLSNVKKNAYLLPVMPAMVLVTVQGLRVIWDSRRVPAARRFVPGLVTTQVAIGMGLAIAAAVTTFLMPPRRAAMNIMLAVVVLIALLGLAIVAAQQARRQRWLRWSLLQSLGYVAGLFVVSMTAVTPHANERSAREVAARVAPLLAGGAALDPAVPEDFSLYLPPDAPYATAASRSTIAVIDDRSDTATAASGSRAFTFARGNPSAGTIEPLDFRGVRGAQRWKVFLLTRTD